MSKKSIGKTEPHQQPAAPQQYDFPTLPTREIVEVFRGFSFDLSDVTCAGIARWNNKSVRMIFCIQLENG